MKAKTIRKKLLSPVHICIFFTLIAITLQAHAEYYLAYGGEPAMIELTGYRHHVMGHHHGCHHHHWAAHKRNSYSISVYYFLQPACCGAAYYVPVEPVEYVPVHRHYYPGEVVFMAQPDLYAGSQVNEVGYSYDPDQRTGDDVGDGMDIDY